MTSASVKYSAAPLALLLCMVLISAGNFNKSYQTDQPVALQVHWTCMSRLTMALNTLRLRQNGRHFADDTLKRILVNENVRISIKISLKFVPKGPINNIPTLVQIMAWRRSGDKPLSESMMVSLPTHICVTRPQWVNSLAPGRSGPIFCLLLGVSTGCAQPITGQVTSVTWPVIGRA